MKRILVAEDNDSNFILMTYILKKKYEIARAKDGKEAVEMAETGEYDLILMDIKMPNMNGLEATAAIRKRDANIPIFALTANAFDTDRDDALAIGCNEFIPKPVNAELCLKKIAEYVGE